MTAALSIPEIVERARQRTFPGQCLEMGTGARSQEAIVRRHGIALGSAYAPIYEIGTHGGAQALSAEPSSAARFGDELGFQALTLRLDDLPVAQTEEQPAGQTTRQPAEPPTANRPANQPAARPIDPLTFDALDNPALVELDRMLRALHAINFLGAQRHGLLFLPVHERLLKSVKYDHGRHFSNVLLSFGLNPARIVIELPAAAVAHRTFLGYLTKNYHQYGFRVAGNLPNAGQILAISDMARLDFVKMDAGAALRDSMVKPLVSYAARLRIPLIFTHVTSAAQFDTLQQYDVRFVQGPLFAELAAESATLSTTSSATRSAITPATASATASPATSTAPATQTIPPSA